MKRLIKLISMAMVVILLTIGLSGCFGNFALTRKVYEFNENFSNKWENQFLFMVMAIAPIYGAAAMADMYIFNSIEFWTGVNPMAMAPGNEIIKYSHENGKDLKIIISQNKIRVEDMQDPAKEMQLNYKPFEKAWYYKGETGDVKIAVLSDTKADFLLPTGKSVTVKKDI